MHASTKHTTYYSILHVFLTQYQSEYRDVTFIRLYRVQLADVLKLEDRKYRNSL